MTTIPQQLGFDGEETKVFNELTGRERRAFDALPDNNSKIHFIRGMVVKERSWREKSVCLARRHVFCLEYFTDIISAPSSLLNIPFFVRKLIKS
jgi:hypothetical protein